MVSCTLPLGIDESLDQQHGMAVAGLPVGGEPLERHAQHARAQIGDREPRQEQEAAVVGDQTQAAVPLCAAPADVGVALAQVLCRRAEDQQRQPVALRVGGGVVESFAQRLEASKVVMLLEQAIALRELIGFEKAHLHRVEDGLFVVVG